MIERTRVDPPNGGWGWVIVGAVFTSMGLGYGFYLCIPIIFQAIRMDLDLPLGQLTWVIAIFQFGRAIGCLSMPLLVTRFGYRKPFIILWLISGALFSVSSVLTTPIVIYIFIGVFLGFVCGNTSVLCPVIINRYFTTRKVIAMALSQNGVSLFAFCLAPITQIIMDTYSWRGGLLIIGGVLLNGAAASAVYRPIYLKSEEGRVQSLSFNPAKRVAKLPLFWAVLGAMCFAENGLRGWVMFLVPFARENLGASSIDASLVVSIYSVTGIFGKLFFGFIGDRYRDHAVIISMATMFCACASECLCWFVQSYAALITLVVTGSLSFSAIHTLYLPITVFVVGEHDLKWAQSFIGFATCLLATGVLPLTGLLLDVIGDIRYMFIVSAALVFISMLLHIPIIRNNNQLKD